MQVLQPLHESSIYNAAYYPAGHAHLPSGPELSDSNIDPNPQFYPIMKRTDVYTSLEEGNPPREQTYSVYEQLNSTTLLPTFQSGFRQFVRMLFEKSITDYNSPTGDTPGYIKLLCFGGGLCMLISGVSSALNLFMLVLTPSVYLMRFYQGLFGLIIILIEAKEWDFLSNFKPVITTWFKFLTVPAGKGAFYVYVGTLTLTFWLRSVFSAIIGLYMIFLGCVCVMLHVASLRKTVHAETNGAQRNAYSGTHPPNYVPVPTFTTPHNDAARGEPTFESEGEDEDEPALHQSHAFHRDSARYQRETTTTTAADGVDPIGSMFNFKIHS